MRPYIRLAAAALTAFALFSPAAQAVTLVPGTYRLEWRIPAADEDVGPLFRRGIALQPIPEDDRKKIEGLVSDNCYWGNSERLRVILDESKGTGKGYDTAYVAMVEDNAHIELSKAAEVALDEDAHVLRSGSVNSDLLDVAIGEQVEQIVKQVAVNLAAFESAEGCPEFATLSLRGGWFGRIKTDSGEIEVRAIDMNGNGIYGDRCGVQDSVSAQDFPNPGDLLVLGASPNKIEEWVGVMYLGQSCLYDGALYTFDLSKAGETLTVAPYTGETGTLRFEGADGYGKPIPFRIVGFYGRSGVYIARGDKPLTVPVGDYACVMAALPLEQGNTKDEPFGLTLRSDTIAKVNKDQETVLKIGGPMKVEIEPTREPVTAKPGDELNVELVFTAGGCPVIGVDGDRRAWVNLRDSRGKLLISKQTGFG